MSSNSLTYGEVEFDGFRAAMDLVVQLKGKRQGGATLSFVDLGSGTGVAVMQAALSGTFGSALGVEIVPGLHDIATACMGRR